MPLPSIKITLPLLFVLWLAGAWAAGMTALWAYPAMWGAIAIVFAGLHAVTSGEGGAARGQDAGSGNGAAEG